MVKNVLHLASKRGFLLNVQGCNDIHCLLQLVTGGTMDQSAQGDVRTLRALGTGCALGLTAPVSVMR